MSEKGIKRTVDKIFKKNPNMNFVAKYVFDEEKFYSTHGEMAPENLSPEKRREFLNLVKDNGLIISALCGDLGGGGFIHKDLNEARVEKSKRILDLSKKLECNIVTTHIGHVPDEECEQKEIMRKACRELALYADSVGAAFAVETGCFLNK